ncbi:hypothetical protein AVEN_211722-1 [Araneus ventricosus]|uniref:Uncharacterized protein n=1 Tax=Araneus ventricosus TaxID=182803 RepID=A0A4Y2R5S7_ARAVE|nr:hypothetical protein AVEN_211722-1 [Araneus ventricosus]
MNRLIPFLDSLVRQGRKGVYSVPLPWLREGCRVYRSEGSKSTHLGRHPLGGRGRPEHCGGRNRTTNKGCERNHCTVHPLRCLLAVFASSAGYRSRVRMRAISFTCRGSVPARSATEASSLL